ncbi:MAG: neutral/alkaline non-lysosomal ceramidase N-terminal domain-containing protein [Bacteroidota bacterium]|nr:neutral/alkaline non-lysosomal ceramidase N-terminal domain-containing protein [Cytophagales bacterium]MCE2958006.1 neutral/alkaline non-lysosomal ceramidase N-terminal domain-containing protein [Flammeovirgaceae bacterium]MCZ8069947.1 neutral/alkaline non-lysosomal ceramidase N-terminal domain-containing protein [Cytophagales bacterium]
MKKLLKIITYTLTSLCLLAITLVGRIDDTPLKEQPFYQTMMKRLDTLSLRPHNGTSPLMVGWSEFNITPAYSMPMAGYTPKDRFNTIHDSLYCRILSISNGSSQSFIISLDLMLFPPVIKDRLNDYLAKNKIQDFLYFTATHTHSSLGGWDDSIVGRFTIGTFHEEWVESTTQQIIRHMDIARQTAKPSRIAYWESDASEYVENRLDNASPTDGFLRGINITRADSSRAVLATFSGHPTNIELLGRTLSGDYPAMLVKELKQRGYAFGMFMAGMVGSHRVKGFDGEQFAKIDSIGKTLVRKFELAKSTDTLPAPVSIIGRHIPIAYGPSQLHFEPGWKARDWAFRGLIGELRGELTYLKIGNITFIGTPCDFSGEIFAEAEWQKWCTDNNQHLIITSFNGNYVGYITADHHYGKKEEEVLALNWVGPHFGEYFKQMIERCVKQH